MNLYDGVFLDQNRIFFARCRFLRKPQFKKVDFTPPVPKLVHQVQLMLWSSCNDTLGGR
ncbi:hypothetical protein AVEN_211927-1, partial [Araneus ventricosus]